MSRLASTLGAATLCVALLASVPQTADAQARYQAPTNQVDITAYTGWDFPTLDLQDAASAGPMIGLSGGYRLHEQVTLRFDGNASFLASSDYGQGIEGPSVTMVRLTSGVEVNLFDPKLTKWRFLVSGHAGWSFLSSEDLPQSQLTTTTEASARTAWCSASARRSAIRWPSPCCSTSAAAATTTTSPAARTPSPCSA